MFVFGGGKAFLCVGRLFCCLFTCLGVGLFFLLFCFRSLRFIREEGIDQITNEKRYKYQHCFQPTGVKGPTARKEAAPNKCEGILMGKSLECGQVQKPTGGFLFCRLL